jgi:two-component system sensor histidine kinase HydH
VRNPLGVMRSSAQELAETIPASNADGRQASSFILAEIDRLNSVISSLLGFARPPRLECRAVPVRTLFEQASLLAREELRAKQIHLTTGFAPGTNDGAAAVHADPDLLNQVLLGLLTNAAQALPPGGRIDLEASAGGDAVEIRVSDSGPGVPLDQRDHIFEPFFTTRKRGTGLGLAVARQIVEAHGGTIAVDDSPLGGARFLLHLPRGAGAAIAA